MTRAEDALRAELEERLQFEALLVDLSARFVHLPADQVDGLIEEAQRRIVQTLGLDRSTLLQRADTEEDLVITHAWAGPDFAPQPGLFAKRDFPWVHQTRLRGGTVRFATLADLPADAARDTASFRKIRQKSNVIFPLAALTQTGWRIRGPAGAAALLGLKPTTLESRIKKLGLQRPR